MHKHVVEKEDKQEDPCKLHKRNVINIRIFLNCQKKSVVCQSNLTCFDIQIKGLYPNPPILTTRHK